MIGIWKSIGSSALLILALQLGASPALAQAPAPVPAPAPADNGITVQASGPIHEAFAEPTPANPQPGSIVPKQPPDPIPEQPPDQKPEGDNVVWIPGYWAWDVDRGDYLWVSGFWRIPPPGQRWVPGYWAQADGGWQWVPGLWAPIEQQDVSYLPPPPASVDNGPTIPAPSDDSIYVPGCWLWQATRYLWRPGFWMPGRPGWLWNPSYYSWTPQGCVYVDGFWDRALEDRGVLFAPVAFSQPLWNNPGWAFQPSYAVDLGNVCNSLFVNPGYSHYFFGNYYAPAYARLGFQPWFAYGGRTHDPLFSYYRWANRGNPGWLTGQQQLFAARQRGGVALPGRTLGQQNELLRLGRDNGHLRMVAPLNQLPNNHFRMTPLNAAQRRASARRPRTSTECARNGCGWKINAAPAPSARRRTGQPAEAAAGGACGQGSQAGGTGGSAGSPGASRGRSPTRPAWSSGNAAQCDAASSGAASRRSGAASTAGTACADAASSGAASRSSGAAATSARSSADSTAARGTGDAEAEPARGPTGHAPGAAGAAALPAAPAGVTRSGAASAGADTASGASASAGRAACGSRSGPGASPRRARGACTQATASSSEARLSCSPVDITAFARESPKRVQPGFARWARGRAAFPRSLDSARARAERRTGPFPRRARTMAS